MLAMVKKKKQKNIALGRVKSNDRINIMEVVSANKNLCKWRTAE